MSEHEPDEHDDPMLVGGSGEPGRRRAASRRRSVPGCIAVLVALAVVVGGLYFVASWGVGAIKDQFDGADDYPGPGHGKVSFEVKKGDTVAAMGRNLKADGVVASVQAFTDAAAANPDSTRIQVGFYALKKEMAADDVVEILVDPDNIVKDTVTIPEGLRVVDIVKLLAKNTDFSAADFTKVLDHPDQLGLPDYAGGNPEGYLFPATYDFGPTATPESILQDMVTRWKQAADDADLESAAADLGYTPQELMTVASLVQAEGRGDDMPKIARVIYNRIEHPDNGITNGLLQVDASVNYALNRSTIAVLTQDQIDSVADSPYNTYKQVGLPPTPIEAPGDDAIAAAAHPADGDWLFYVTVNLRTGETKFTDSYDEFLQFKQELQDYCATQSDRC
ncbi:endolytic transglycosylase MltG [Nocardioides mangrovi]|uniref:Endolytic murein transglycosylase n=1 Tax=Nocardioides mangrovi TaxID=2874580 RepID=A0ABS7UKT7_9ACTN|nr:endolytic transglycosylase MltG [Nocardioides mangrovi]MBZ5741276.1 endolytic transglycosylase MltG [Nocardioides mangrovi]